MSRSAQFSSERSTLIILHAVWPASSGLSVFGEDAARQAAAGGGRRRRLSKPERALPHPFACDIDTLDSALADVAGIFAADGAGREPIELHLPSSPTRPLPSPLLERYIGAAGPAKPQAVELAVWRVPALVLDAAGALDTLLAVAAARDAGRLPADVGIGDSLHCLGEVARLALELAAAGRVVPALVRIPNGDGGRGRNPYYAVWRPRLNAVEDRARVTSLAEAMPPAIRAAEPDRSPHDIVGSVLNELVDACVREACAESSPTIGRQRRARTSSPPSAAEAWIRALSAPEPVIPAPVSALRALERKLGDWLEPARSQGARFRTCFRLSAPAGPEPENGVPEHPAGPNGGADPDAAGEKWRIDFLLQANDDASLVVPAARVWTSRRADLEVPGHTFHNASETLLADLGRASRLFPPIESALGAAAPAGLEMDTAGAHAFLRETAPLLEQAGFGVLVPPWWRRKPARLGVRLRATPTAEGDGRFGLQSLCRYEWRLALGDETLTIEEFRKLARLKVPLVRIRGQWVELRPEDVEAALSLLERDAVGAEMTVADALRVGLGIASSPAGLPVVGLDAGDWLDDLLATTGDRPPRRMSAPPGFRGTLRPYQERGLAWLSFLDRLGVGACLADDMGLGKTIQLLALLVAERNGDAGRASGSRRRKSPKPRGTRRTSRAARDSGARAPTLLVCPMSVVGNWQHEAERFTPDLRVHVHHGAERPAGRAFERAVKAADLVITTYALAARDRDELAAVQWSRVVLDEAQNVKNSAALQAKAVRAIPADRRIALTGTPVENRLSELWSIFEFLNAGLLGGATEFRKRFARPIERYRDQDAAARLKRVTAPFILRRLKTDRAVIRDLPDKLEMKVYCNLTREQATLYQAVVDEMLEKIESSEGMSRRGLVLSTMMKLKQVCNHPAQMLADRSAIAGRSGKLARLEEVLDEVIDAGDRALVFTQFTEMGHMLENHLRDRFGRAIPFLHGGTSKTARDAMVARFQSDDSPPVLLISLRAGGTGLNLTAASHVVHFDRWWNPAVEDQATDRAFRIGQTRNVQVRKFICSGTLEERIDAMIEHKKDLAERIVGAGEAWLTELSADELRDIVTLSADAVVE